VCRPSTATSSRPPTSRRTTTPVGSGDLVHLVQVDLAQLLDVDGATILFGWYCFSMPACSRKAGKLLETCCTVMDLKGVGITSVPSVYGYVKQASDWYPLPRTWILLTVTGSRKPLTALKTLLKPHGALTACSRKAGKLLETCCTVMDLKGVGITSVPSVYGFNMRSAVVILYIWFRSILPSFSM
jgi:hypothetical protein